MAKTNNHPMRRCTGCRQSFEKSSLLRVVPEPDGRLIFDRTQKKAGRGAYVCRNRDCIDRAVRTKGFSRSFRKNVNPAPVIDALYGEA